MNIEFHHTPLLAKLFLRHRFFRDFDLFLRQGRFALMKSDVYYASYHRMYFVNFVDKICVEKFLC
ncbi:unnamed protein product [Meloidogyne enterolobii]|uniref:Uncharacterized protein n=1 Tax=Meloidogyne enterolobii TaxID=390850 RepID=A0ACB0YE73_MELEN